MANSLKINYFVSQSYKNEELDADKVNVIVKLLNRSELKNYLRGLKKKEKEKSVVVVSAFEQKDTGIFEKAFPKRKIIYKKDPSLLVGVKIIDNDNVYELNLKNTLNDIVNHVEKIYD